MGIPYISFIPGLLRLYVFKIPHAQFETITAFHLAFDIRIISFLMESCRLVIISSCLFILLLLESQVLYPSSFVWSTFRHYSIRGGKYGIYIDNYGNTEVSLSGSVPNSSQEHVGSRFSIIIVTHNEPLLNQTYFIGMSVSCRIRTVLENTPPKYLYEVLLYCSPHKNIGVSD